jgi:2-polyprenyl-3-methyl-5-hydroxy-6-metoxy-1,4-benzoquinol methylase
MSKLSWKYRECINAIRSELYWLSVAARDRVSATPSVQNDRFWLECLLQPERGQKYCKTGLPSLPPDDVQKRFTGRHGRVNLEQAFQFYKFISQQCGLDNKPNPKVLDFGGGWGRIARFFLRNTKPGNIWVTDLMSESMRWLKETKAPFNLIQNNPLPPIDGLNVKFDIIFAFSVFSHLSEEYFTTWVKYLLGMLEPGGSLVFTSRGTQFISALELFHRHGEETGLTSNLPPPTTIREKYRKGEFQFYPLGPGPELKKDFYGEAFIPVQFVQKLFSRHLVLNADDVPFVDQTIYVLNNPQAAS